MQILCSGIKYLLNLSPEMSITDLDFINSSLVIPPRVPKERGCVKRWGLLPNRRHRVSIGCATDGSQPLTFPNQRDKRRRELEDPAWLLARCQLNRRGDESKNKRITRPGRY